MSIALYVLTINKNLLASFFLLAIIPVFAFCTLNKITKKYKEKINYILRDIPRKKEKIIIQKENSINLYSKNFI